MISTHHHYFQGLKAFDREVFSTHGHEDRKTPPSHMQSWWHQALVNSFQRLHISLGLRSKFWDQHRRPSVNLASLLATVSIAMLHSNSNKLSGALCFLLPLGLCKCCPSRRKCLNSKKSPRYRSCASFSKKLFRKPLRRIQFPDCIWCPPHWHLPSPLPLLLLHDPCHSTQL